MRQIERVTPQVSFFGTAMGERGEIWLPFGSLTRRRNCRTILRRVTVTRERAPRDHRQCRRNVGPPGHRGQVFRVSVTEEKALSTEALERAEAIGR